MTPLQRVIVLLKEHKWKFIAVALLPLVLSLAARGKEVDPNDFEDQQNLAWSLQTRLAVVQEHDRAQDDLLNKLFYALIGAGVTGAGSASYLKLKKKES